MGAYLVNTLKFGGQEVGWAYGAFAIGSMISPFLVGLLADRYFASEKLLAVFSLIGGAVLCLLPSLNTFLPFYSTLILYCALYVPTLALGNSLALTHLEDSKTAFPRVKLWSRCRFGLVELSRLIWCLTAHCPPYSSTSLEVSPLDWRSSR